MDVREDLAALGQRLEFRTADDGAWDLRWLKHGEEAYVFTISATAALASHVLDTRRPALQTRLEWGFKNVLAP